ncbi:spore germination protein [Thermanaeromonas sp. C210]|uniref:spore germination protein n=1 Tax=Thermanaeromonas sp. C210 TaxID=2731925 RepID=UPI00155CD7F1|nr:spore germination protein [Thermanaeromonas sp. C210]GFN23426.1 spore germination protein [Thermanaeromonas sp. C210]
MTITGEGVKVSRKLEVNVEWLNKELGVNESFDIIRRDIRFASRQASLFYIDGFVKDEIMLFILRTLSGLDREDLAVDAFKKVFEQYIHYIEVEALDDLHKVVDKILAGGVAVVVDGFEQVIFIEARQYPARNPDEPDLERVVRGSRDGFVETLLFNTNLLRRRLRDPRLRIENLQAGSRSKTDIAVAYIKDIANPRLVDMVKKRIKAIKIDGLPMAEKSVEELITPGNWWNPFPRVRYTERPDVAATHLLEGHVLIMVDTSPSVMILPVTLFHHLQHAEEYRQVPLVGAFLRWVRFLGVGVSVFLAPVWLLFALDRSLIPPGLEWLGPNRIASMPLMWQFLLAEGGINLMRMAAIHTPTALATALGLIAAVLIGEVAVAVGFFNPEIILYVAIAAVGIFATPSYELGMANTLVRIAAIIGVGLWRLPGLVVVTMGTFLLLLTTKSFGVPYLWPLIPWDWRSLKSILLRSPVPLQNLRPPALQPQDEDRQPAPAYKPLLEQGQETLRERLAKTERNEEGEG